MKKHHIGVVAIVATAAVLLAGCSASSSSNGGTNAASLRIGEQQGIVSLNPVSNPIANSLTYAYDSLIYQNDKGDFLPDLATKWGYVGTGNTTFSMTIRSGAKFADGADVSAKAVVASIEYFLKTPGPNFRNVGQIKSVEANGNEVIVHYASAFPNAESAFSQYYGIGLIIGPTGLANPDGLAQATDGAGPYVYDAKSSTANVQYTFVKNKKYWNPSAAKFSAVVLKVYSDANARLAALKSGQIDIASQMPLGQLGASAANGFTKVQGYTNVKSMQFLTSTGPLVSVKVRQALNYALDRNAIVTSYALGYGRALDQVASVGTAGYSSALEGTYSHNVSKAKALLEDAGYGKGFTLNVVTNGVSDPGGLLTQVVQTQLARIGVTVKLTVLNGTFQQFSSALTSGSYDAVVYGLFSVDLYTLVQQSILGPMTLLHPSTEEDPTVAADMAQASTASSSAAFEAALQKLNNYATQNALTLPIYTAKTVDLYSSKLSVPVTLYTSQQPSTVAPVASFAVGQK